MCTALSWVLYEIKANDTDSALQRILVGKGRCSINQLCKHLVPFDKCVKGKQNPQGGLHGGLLRRSHNWSRTKLLRQWEDWA